MQQVRGKNAHICIILLGNKQPLLFKSIPLLKRTAQSTAKA
jgi:hypothetical protein